MRLRVVRDAAPRRTLLRVTPRRRPPSILPGLLVAVSCAALAYALAQLPGFAMFGPLVLALVLAALWRGAWSTRVQPGRFDAGARFEAGAEFAAGPLLKLGIVALGVRLDLRAVIELGPWLLLGGALGALVAFGVAEQLGRALAVPPSLRRATGVGTAICGASAIAAAAPVLGAAPAQVSAAIGSISLLGSLGVLGFAVWDAFADVAAAPFGVLAGATLQEVGQVVAAGSVGGHEAADVALLVKLSRVVLLAPALVALGWWSRRFERRSAAPARAGERAPALPWPVPPFVLGFLALGAVATTGWLDVRAVGAISSLGTVLTAAAMAGIGMGLDLRTLRGPGRQALVVGAVAFMALLFTMTGYYALVS